MSWLGYAKWQNAEKAIERAKKSLENQNYVSVEHVTEVSKVAHRQGSGSLDVKDFELSRLGCYTVAMNADPDKEMVALAQGYFAAQTRKAEVVVPAQSDRIRELELENENLRLRKDLGGLQNSMLAIHGREVVLALNGQSGAIVREEVKVTEVVDLQSGTNEKILSAEQLKAEVGKRTGQKLKSQAQFVAALRKFGRDDLLVPVRRQVLSEYVRPDRLDEAISVVYGKSRQKLIGE